MNKSYRTNKPFWRAGNIQPIPLLKLSAVGLVDGVLSTLANTGSLAGTFTPTGTGNITVGTVAGKKALTFPGTNRLVGSINAPASITGQNPYTVISQLYNPSIALEEAYLTWAQRGTSSRCAQFNFGTSPDYGAVTHWDSADMGFLTPTPLQNSWVWIAITYDGSIERIYINGVLNNIETKILNIWPNQKFVVGASYENSNASDQTLNFTGSIADIMVYSGALTAQEIISLSK